MAMRNQRIILAGGGGFLGRSLTPVLLARGYEVVIFSREPLRRVEGARMVEWDGVHDGAWSSELEGARAVIGLAG
jgi:nucleoside-diphosphate-sugar epimerase